MDKLLQNERLRVLLREADDATRLLERLGESGGEAAEIREAQLGIYRDIGRLVHAHWRTILRVPVIDDTPLREAADPGAETDEQFSHQLRGDDLQDPTGEAGFPVDHTDVPDATLPPAQGEDLERWYTDEVEIPSTEPLFSPGELDENTADTELVGARARFSESGAIPSLLGRTFADDDGRVADAESIFHDAPAVGEPPPWLESLRELLTMIGSPDELASGPGGGDPAAEVSRVQWATTNIDVRWAEFPPSIQVALLGLLAARARHLQERLDVDVGPRMALDRLRRFRKASGVSTVTGLIPERGPEASSWAEDARRWWDALNDGLNG